MSHKIFTSYFASALTHDKYFKICDGLAKIIQEKMADEHIEKYTIVVRGVSGLLVGPYISAKLKQKFVVVRKPGDSAHCLDPVEGAKKVRDYIIVDDFVDTGATVNVIHSTMRDVYTRPNLRGVFCYQKHTCVISAPLKVDGKKEKVPIHYFEAK